MTTSTNPFVMQPMPTMSPILNVSGASAKNNESNITFYANQSEMLKVTPDGFYVRGKKLDVDDDEAKEVYKAFRQFLIWSALVKS